MKNLEKTKAEPDTLDGLRKALDCARASAASEKELYERLSAERIQAVFRRTEDGRIYAATFIDHGRGIVLNGSRLGKEYAARAWDTWVRTPRPEETVARQPDSAATPDVPFASDEPHRRLPDAGKQQEQGQSLIGDILFAGLESFDRLFEHEPEVREYIDPEFRLLHRKRKKRKKRSLKL